jgi:hypothetical protein
MKAKVARWLEKNPALSCACSRNAVPGVANAVPLPSLDAPTWNYCGVSSGLAAATVDALHNPCSLQFHLSVSFFWPKMQRGSVNVS